MFAAIDVRHPPRLKTRRPELWLPADFAVGRVPGASPVAAQLAAADVALNASPAVMWYSKVDELMELDFARHKLQLEVLQIRTEILLNRALLVSARLGCWAGRATGRGARGRRGDEGMRREGDVHLVHRQRRWWVTRLTELRLGGFNSGCRTHVGGRTGSLRSSVHSIAPERSCPLTSLPPIAPAVHRAAILAAAHVRSWSGPGGPVFGARLQRGALRRALQGDQCHQGRACAVVRGATVVWRAEWGLGVIRSTLFGPPTHRHLGTT